MRVLTAEQSRSAESRAVAETGVDTGALMEAAGRALADAVDARVPDGPVVVLAGPGNNGGDGWAAARILFGRGRDVRVLSLRHPDALPEPARATAHRAASSGVPWSVRDAGLAEDDLAEATCVIDALLGIGAMLPLRAPLDAWAAAVDRAEAFVVAADAPSGVDADTGVVPGAAIHADCTVTFIAPKRGLVMFPGAEYVGELLVADIGVESRFADAEAPEIWSAEEYAATLPVLRADAHKNERGRLLVIAGSGRFPGAAILATRGAMRVGTGYVTLAVPDSVTALAQAHLLAAPVVGLPQGRLRTFVTGSIESALDLAHDYDAVMLGPGLTLTDGAVAFVRALVARLDKPLVLDADGLNALVDAHELLDHRRAPTVLTPHPGELARLLGVPTPQVQSDRLDAGMRLAATGRVVVLKGAATITSEPGRQVINTSGTPALATAGTGDVLAGVIGGLIAQGVPGFNAAALGAYLHGRAGDHAEADLTAHCVTAEDIPDYLPAAFSGLLDL